MIADCSNIVTPVTRSRKQTAAPATKSKKVRSSSQRSKASPVVKSKKPQPKGKGKQCAGSGAKDDGSVYEPSDEDSSKPTSSKKGKARQRSLGKGDEQTSASPQRGHPRKGEAGASSAEGAEVNDSDESALYAVLKGNVDVALVRGLLPVTDVARRSLLPTPT